MRKAETQTTTQTNQPKTVRVATLVQTSAIVALTAGIMAFIAGYFVTIHVYDYTHYQVTSDVVTLLKGNTSPASNN